MLRSATKFSAGSCYSHPCVCVCGSSAPVANYDAARAVAKRVLAAKAQEVQSYTARLHKAQQAAENALDM